MSESDIDRFEGEFAFLSNFYVEPDRLTVEHEFQAAKTNDLAEKVAILDALTPGQAKKLGRRCTLRDDWEEVKVNVMRSLVLRKFYDHPELAEKLLATGDRKLIEGNHWHDTFWGVCNGVGQNWLGIILMEIRDLIRAYE